MTNSNDRNTNRNAREHDQMGAKDQLDTEKQPTGSATEESESDTSRTAEDQS